MRRARVVVVTACLCAVTGCRGGAAREPYDGAVVTTGGPSRAAAVPALAPDAGPIASEVDVPWALALLSDAEAPVVKQPRRAVVVVDREPAVEDGVSAEADGDLRLAADHDHDPSDERRPPPKACSGVVHRRS